MVHPHLVVADRFNHQSALFAAWNDRVYSHYDIPAFEPTAMTLPGEVRR